MLALALTPETEGLIGAEELALVDTVLAGFVRVVTNPRFLEEPSAPSKAMSFVSALRAAERARWVPAGHQVWQSLERLVAADRGIRGNRVPDAYLAAVAITHGCRLATADRGFARTVAVKPGRHTVCVTAYNLARTPGTSSRIGCKVVTVR